MFVDRLQLSETWLVAAKRCRQKTGLLEQLRRTAIRLGGGLELSGEQPIEVIYGPANAADVIVQGEHLGDEGRSDMKRRGEAGLVRLTRAGGQDGLALDFRQPARGLGEPRGEMIVKVGAAADVRPRAACGFTEPIAERAL